MTVHRCTVRSPLTGCQVTSRPHDWFLRYSKWLDTFWTALISMDRYSFSWVTCHLMTLNQSVLVCDDMTYTWQTANEKEWSGAWPISMHMHLKWVRKPMEKILMQTAGVQTGSGNITLRNTSHMRLWSQTDWVLLHIYFAAGNMTFICMCKTHVCKVSGQKSKAVMENIQL